MEPRTQPDARLAPIEPDQSLHARWFWSRRETSRVLAVGAILLVLGTIVTTVSVRRISSLEDGVGVATAEIDPVLDALSDVRSGQLRELAAFDDAAHATDTVSQALLFEESRRALSETETAWREYLRTSLDLTGEREQQVRYEALRAETDVLSGLVGLAIVDGTALDDVIRTASFEDLRDKRAQQHAIVEQLTDDLYRPEAARRATALQDDIGGARREVRIIIALIALCGTALFVMAWRSSRNHERTTRRAEIERAERSRRDGLEARLHRALDMARTEVAAYDVVQRSLQQLVAGAPAEVLVADNAQAHFQQVLSTDAEHRGPGCPVVSPAECPAASGADTRRFLDSEALDACPHLRGRSGGACSAVCVPMRLAGTGIGVVHLTGPRGELPGPTVTSDVELVSTQAGERLGLLRLLAETTQQARHDHLTGLLNRRSLESAVARMEGDGEHYVVAYGDVDRFKALNDSYGHDTGDRALRLLSRVLRDSVRPMDLVARYGGEEFLVVLPRCSTTEAAEVIERVRSALQRELEGSMVPSFTISFGLASDEGGATFDSVVGRADQALLAAKEAGRDRILVAGGPLPGPRGA